MLWLRELRGVWRRSLFKNASYPSLPLFYPLREKINFPLGLLCGNIRDNLNRQYYQIVILMLITCEQCGTRFNLDNSLITGDVVKVRCSRCQHVFAVPAGDRGQPEAAAESPAATEKPSASDIFPAEPPPRPEPEPAGAEELFAEPTPAEESLLAGGPASPVLETGGEKPKKTSRAAIFAIMSGCLLGLLLALIALWYLDRGEGTTPDTQSAAPGSTQRLAPPLPPAAPRELRNLVVTLHDARYQKLVNVTGGQLLVIQGEVKNLTGEPRGPVRLKAALVDPMNQPVQELLFYSGTAIADEELLQSDPEVIKRWLATPGGRQGVRVIKAGASQPFTAVLFGVPDNLAEARFGFNIVVMDGPRVSAE
jgi:predicted Zn finger-like uncharacterized protein